MGGTRSFKSPNKSQISTEKRECGEERGGEKRGERDKINSMKKRQQIEMCVSKAAMVAEEAKEEEERIDKSNTGKI